MPDILERLPIPDATAESTLVDALDLYKRGADDCVSAAIDDDVPLTLTAAETLIQADNKMDALFGILNTR